MPTWTSSHHYTKSPPRNPGPGEEACFKAAKHPEILYAANNFRAVNAHVANAAYGTVWEYLGNNDSNKAGAKTSNLCRAEKIHIALGSAEQEEWDHVKMPAYESFS